MSPDAFLAVYMCVCADVPNSESGVKYLNNHLRLIIFHHEETTHGYRIVGFEVEAYSVAHKLADNKEWYEPKAEEWTSHTEYLTKLNANNKLSTCNPGPGEKVTPQRVSDFPATATDQDKSIIFTYDVHWEVWTRICICPAAACPPWPSLACSCTVRPLTLCLCVCSRRPSNGPLAGICI